MNIKQFCNSKNKEWDYCFKGATEISIFLLISRVKLQFNSMPVKFYNFSIRAGCVSQIISTKHRMGALKFVFV